MQQKISEKNVKEIRIQASVCCRFHNDWGMQYDFIYNPNYFLKCLYVHIFSLNTKKNTLIYNDHSE